MNKKPLNTIEKIIAIAGLVIVGGVITTGVVGAINNRESTAEKTINQATKEMEIATCELQEKLGEELTETCKELGFNF